MYVAYLLARMLLSLLTKLMLDFLDFIGKGNEYESILIKEKPEIFELPISKIVCLILGSLAILVLVPITINAAYTTITKPLPNVNNKKFVERIIMFPSQMNIQQLRFYQDPSSTNEGRYGYRYYAKKICSKLPYEKLLKFVSYEKVIFASDSVPKEITVPNESQHRERISNQAPYIISEKECDRNTNFEEIDKKTYEKLSSLKTNDLFIWEVFE